MTTPPPHLRRRRRPSMPGLAPLCCLVALLAPALRAQLDEEVSFTNKTGEIRTGLRVTYNQPLAPGQPELSSAYGFVPPFSNISYPSSSSFLLWGGAVPHLGRVPSWPAGSTFNVRGTVPDLSMSIVEAVWLLGNEARNTVVRFRVRNGTGRLANQVMIQAIGPTGQLLPIIDADFLTGFDPRWCTPSPVGVPGTTIGLGLNCCISGFEGDIGPIQLTMGTPEPVTSILVRWLSNGVKVGSAAVRRLVNQEGGPPGAAAALSVRTNIPITQIGNDAIAPFERVTGLRSTDVYLYGGVVPSARPLRGDWIAVTSNDTGPTDIRVTGLHWYRPFGGPVPDLLHYTFDELGGSITENHAVPGPTGVSPGSPVFGHSLGAVPGQFERGLRGGGGTGATSYVNTGWLMNLGSGDWTISVWLDLSGTTPPSGMRLFGDLTAGFEGYLSGTEAVLRIGSLQVAIPDVTPGSGPVSCAWTRSGTLPEIRAYRNGIQVRKVSVPAFQLTGNEPFRIGASSPYAPALAAGVRLDELRLYRRALSPTEIAAAAQSLLGGPTSDPQWQVNCPEATLVVNQPGGGPLWPNDVSCLPGEPVNIVLSSVHGGAAQLSMSVASPPMRPRQMSGLAPLPGGQIVNVEPTTGIQEPSIVFELEPYPALVQVPLPQPFPSDLYLQLAVISPTMPGGIALSAPAGLHVSAEGTGAIIPGPAVDDGMTQVIFGAAPLHGPPSVPFAGTSWPSCYVSSNGLVSFGTGSISFSPSVAEFQSGPPRLAGLWTDLDPSLGGSITATAFEGAVVVRYRRVPAHGWPELKSGVTLVFDASEGSCAIHGYDPAPWHPLDTLVGLTPGAPIATHPGATLFWQLRGLGPQFGSPTDMRYQLVIGGAPSGFNSIIFPYANGSVMIVE